MSYGSWVCIGLAGWFLYQWILFRVTRAKVKTIPTMGSDGFISSYIAGWKYLFKGHEMIQEGYKKYPGMVFKVPTFTTPNGWLIVLNGPKLIHDVRKASEEELNFLEVGFEFMHSDHLWGTDSARNIPYQIGVVRGPLTRGFPSRFEDIRDEIVCSFTDLFPVTNEWTPFPIHRSLVPIVCRTSNRLFVGLPLCRDPEYLKIQENLTIHVFKSAMFLNLIPSVLRPLVGRLITDFPTSNKRLQKMMGPLIRERMALDDQHGPKWEGRPNDLISWLLDLAPQEGRNVEDLTLRMILINFAAIHTTSITLSNTLFDLAPRPEYIAPLREEVETVIQEYGWTKEAMGRMRKLDSFMKESSRLSGMGKLSVSRKAKKDYTLSNGTVIPAGFRIAVASQPVHEDDAYYTDANEFKGFRFAEMREGGDELDFLRHQMVALDPKFLFFGHGRAACPGRFFAVNEVKAMMAYILMNYDIKLPDGQDNAPPPLWFDANRTPDTNAQIMFRKRQT